MKNNHAPIVRTRTGFSLVEVLVVIAIIVVLAVISLMVVNRMRLAAAKTGSISKMRNISIGIASWMADRSVPEPFYMADGTGDYPHESTRYSDFRPGNPARALYVTEDPSSGYVQDFNEFFSPLAKLPTPAPTLGNYDPTKATDKRLWGTYTYYFPHVTEAKMTSRHRTMGVQPIPASRESINGSLVLSEFYRDDWCPPKFGKRVYHALLSDWSVRHVGDRDEVWSKWKSGK